MWRNTKDTKYLNVICRKKNKPGRIRFPDFTLYYKITVIRTVLYWHKYINIDEGNMIKTPEINQCTCGQLIYSYDKSNKMIKRRKDSLFNKLCWENSIAIWKRMKLEHSGSLGGSGSKESARNAEDSGLIPWSG